MRTRFLLIAVLLIALPLSAERKRRSGITTKQGREIVKAMRPLCERMKEPVFGDWLQSNREEGQTFKEYLDSYPITLTDSRHYIYIQPIGKFSKDQMAVIKNTAKMLGAFYGCPVLTRKAFDESVMPYSAWRIHPGNGQKQFLSTYVMSDVLLPKTPRKAVAYIAFTARDLWPGEKKDYVFGQGDGRRRVGVWSLYRLGNPSGTEDEKRECLLRAFKLAAHETGHMFSIKHCTAYECGMCGINHLGEMDRRPFRFCAECMAKVCWATDANPVDRANDIAEFLTAEGMTNEAALYTQSIKALALSGFTSDRPTTAKEELSDDKE